jgi:uncharacterized membrane protein YqiK
MSLAHHVACLHALVLQADPPSMPVMIGIMVGVTLVSLIGLGVIVAASYQKVDQGQALIIILEVLGRELNGYRLDACTINYLEMTPLEALDPANVSDAKGIRKLEAITDSNR